MMHAWMQNTAGNGKSLTDPPRKMMQHVGFLADCTAVHAAVGHQLRCPTRMSDVWEHSNGACTTMPARAGHRLEKCVE